MKQNKKLFAFKLAEKKQATQMKSQKQFKAREGVALAGCTDPSGNFNVRYDDNGMYC
ncbi:hypothetical protein [Idiomarina xiamenensis]|uniref:Uncharacterized protein n=1 Tax=Idiomarina xiamenensis 10-D-4 TaxID=740709 RepID=K2LCN9_9GAMM|nr:hypothetical protein [Idiomarina xiamenensis]EKE87650.1 hypothetical protein A10D4_01110 [Idiomarina xiamenensis 10-D-4]